MTGTDSMECQRRAEATVCVIDANAGVFLDEQLAVLEPTGERMGCDEMIKVNYINLISWSGS